MSYRVGVILVAAVILLVVSILLSNRLGMPGSGHGEGHTEKSAESIDRQTGDDRNKSRDEESDQMPAESSLDDSVSATEFTHGGESLNWHAISDVDALYAELVERFEAGDVHAGYQLFELGHHCLLGSMVLHDIDHQLAAANDPETLQGLRETRDKYQAIEGPCSESQLSQANVSTALQSRWLWRSAEAGHVDAMYDVVFGRAIPVAPPSDKGIEGADERLAYRQRYARQLREACDSQSLHSLGVHFSRESPVSDGLHLGDHDDVDEATAWQLEGFAHRYAAGHLRDEALPEQAARNPDHPLTPAEEAHAMALAEDLLEQCP